MTKTIWRQVAIVYSWVWIPGIFAVGYDLYRVVSWLLGFSTEIWG